MRPLHYLLSISFALFLSCTNSDKETGVTQVQQELSNEITEVTTAVINRTDFKREIMSQGTLHALASVDVRCDVKEVIVQLNISDGQSVAKNDVLVKVDDIEMQRNLQKLEYSMEKIKRDREKLLIAKLGYGFST